MARILTGVTLNAYIKLRRLYSLMVLSVLSAGVISSFILDFFLICFISFVIFCMWNLSIFCLSYTKIFNFGAIIVGTIFKNFNYNCLLLVYWKIIEFCTPTLYLSAPL